KFRVTQRAKTEFDIFYHSELVSEHKAFNSSCHAEFISDSPFVINQVFDIFYHSELVSESKTFHSDCHSEFISESRFIMNQVQGDKTRKNGI
ncbi:hypothetical protein, partial [Ornithobacterium rhinotracheale]